MIVALFFLIFCAAGGGNAALIYLENGVADDHYMQMAATLVMMASSITLIFLFLYKLRQQEKLVCEKRKIMGLLQARMAAVEASMDGIVILNRDGIVKFVNRSFADFQGVDDACAFIEKSWRNLYPETQAQWIEENVLPDLEQNKIWRGNCLGLRRDGSEYYQDISMTRLADGGDVWIVRDYSETLKNAETSNKRLAAIEAAADGIWISSLSGKVVYANRVMMEICGLGDKGNDFFSNMHWYDFFGMEAAQNVAERALYDAEQKSSWKGESNLARTNGETRPVEVSITVLPDGGLVGTVRDISERRLAEREKEALQNQFFQAQKMEAIGRLAGGIAHDFNNILASILGYSEFLKEDLDEKTEQHRFACQIMQASTQAKQLVEQILTFSRRNESAKDAIDIAHSVEETRAMLESTLPAGIDLVVRIDADAAFVSGNRTQIGQTLMNLCVNAVDAMEDEKGTLKILVHSVSGQDAGYPQMMHTDLPAAGYAANARISEIEGQNVMMMGVLARSQKYVCISVLDTGCGMDREIMQRIFEPFFTTKAIDKGTGLGLSTVHGIVSSHQGAMVIVSKPGEGTSFDLYFPASKMNTATNENAGEAGNVSGGNGCIMVVEDQDHVRGMLANMIGRMGYEVKPLPGAEAAIDELRENPGLYNLVISDFAMPGMNGAEMAAIIRDDFPALPIILLSGYSRKKIQEYMAENPSIRAALAKPVDARSLSSEIGAVLNASRRAA